MGIKAALLDERGIFLRVDELENESELTPLHLPKITSCDNEPGKYRWIATDNPTNECGGAFWPVEWLKRFSAEQITKLEHI